MRMRSLRLVLITGAVLGFLLPTATADERPEAPDIADEDIERTIEREIRYDKALPYDLIDVDVTLGVAHLRGRVGSILAKERASKQALTVRGVRSVVNQLRVRPSDARTDDQIAVDVARALRTDPATDAYEVTPRVKDGTVTLVGLVDSWQERELVETVAKGIWGVKAIQNDLTIRHDVDRPDVEIEKEIERALRWNAYIDHALIDVSVDGTTARLSGTVGSAAEKWLATAKAWTHGIRDVDADDLRVARWARDPDLRQDKFRDVPDEKIDAAVASALAQDPRVSGFAVDATVDDGLVTLTGIVDNLRARRAAVRDARDTAGVIGVMDHLKVRTAEAREDAAIAADIRMALKRDPYLHRYDYQVEVEDGVVHVEGDADTWFEYRRVDDIAATTTGARDIRNRVTVLDPVLRVSPYVDEWVLPRPLADTLSTALVLTDDSLLARKIRVELLWSPFVDEQTIEVAVEDGVATLTGTVRSLHERFFAREEAYEAGAHVVHNKLRVVTDDAW